jgi:rhodanese-related sulfurtransferase
MSIFTKFFQGAASISPQEAQRMMQEGGDFTLLDVRTADEYRQLRIPNAKLLPMHELRGRAKKELPDKDAKILVYCHSGARASQAVQELSALGYSGAVNLGGIIKWPYETERG